MITILQQQVNTILLQQQGSRVEVTRPQVFSRKMEEVSTFINAACCKGTPPFPPLNGMTILQSYLVRAHFTQAKAQ